MLPPTRDPAGIYRSGFIVACYLVYSGAAKTIDEGLAQFAAKRFPPKPAPEPIEYAEGEEGEEGGEVEGDDVTGGLGLPVGPGMTSALTAAALAASPGGLTARLYASWRFLMKHIERALSEPSTIPKVLKLSYIIVALPGLARSEGDYPVVQIYQVRPQLQLQMYTCDEASRSASSHSMRM